MPKKTAQQKEAARKGFEKREAKRQQSQGSGSGQDQQQNQQSGAGHGNMSRDKNQDLTSIGPSLASKHGIHKRKNDSVMPSVDSMQRRNWNGEIGLANVSYGRGPQNRTSTDTHTFKLEAETDRPDGNQIITTPQAALDTRQVIPTAEAARPDRLALAKSRNELIEAYSSAGKPRRSRGTRTRGVPQNPVTEVDKVPDLCAECGSNTHTLKGCITTISGSIRGCVFCNTMSHATDTCRQFMELGMGQRVKLLVTDRAGMPPILTEVTWWVWLYTFLTARHTKGQPIPDAVPWRTDFAREVYHGTRRSKSVQEYQSDFDRIHSVGVLPRDWRMQSMNDVFTEFWDKEGRVWPARLDELPYLTEASTGTNSHQGSADAPAAGEVQRLGDTVIRQAMQIGEKDREIERLKKEIEDLKRMLA